MKLIFFSFPDIGTIKLTPSKKDFIASKMVARDWKDIINNELKAVVNEEQILHDFKFLYDQSYAVLRILVEYCNIECWSKMKIILKPINETIVIEFEELFAKSRSG